MAFIAEDWIECRCGHDEFKKETIVVLPKRIERRDEADMNIEHPVLQEKILYVCTQCGRKLDK